MKKPVIVITSGGTGGHIFPAQGVADQLITRLPQSRVIFLAAGLSENRFFAKEQYEYFEVSSGKLEKHPLKAIHSGWRISRGIWQSLRLIRQLQADIVVGFGSYYTLPVLAAAKLAKVPIILHEANYYPGKVNALFATSAIATALHFPGTKEYLKGRSIVTGMPLRTSLQKIQNDREKANQYYAFQTGKKNTLLILGGSQGAKKLNLLTADALIANAQQWSSVLKLIHFAGNEEQAMHIDRLYRQASYECCVKAFEKNMHFAWSAADFSISRAGASTIAEQIEYGVPGLLVPYPFAADNHQLKNAEYFAAVGGGQVLPETTLETSLASSLKECIKDNGKLLSYWKERLATFKSQRKVQDLCSLIEENL